ncbi:Ig-like domain-containing protein [Bacillus wiedmannii]|uniref:Ig-like domain-containing protein n=1 Tax=Bacillus wiedmannii TaxID=1890302 RepID=UPI000BF07CC7|nr:Ig-like domain-containing protein [Bacillus wiedmannii]PEO38858.1 hypothetical protein CN555_11350 [Bacillus wiedmannii]
MKAKKPWKVLATSALVATTLFTPMTSFLPSPHGIAHAEENQNIQKNELEQSNQEPHLQIEEKLTQKSTENRKNVENNDSRALGPELIPDSAYQQVSDGIFEVTNYKFADTIQTAAFTGSNRVYNTSGGVWYSLKNQEPNWKTVGPNGTKGTNFRLYDDRVTSSVQIGAGVTIDTVVGKTYKVSLGYAFTVSGPKNDETQELHYHLRSPGGLIKADRINLSKGDNDAITFEFMGTGGTVGLSYGLYAFNGLTGDGENRVLYTWPSIKEILPDAPVINKVSDTDEKVTGSGTKDAAVSVKIGSTEIGTGKVQADGAYDVAIPKQAAGTVLTVEHTLSGQTKSTTTTVVDEIAPNAPRVDPIKDTDTTVTGTGEKNATVSVKVNGTEIGTNTVDESMNYTVTIPSQAVGTNVDVTLTDAAGNTSLPTQKTVEAAQWDNPTIDEVTDQDTKVTGTAEPEADIELITNYSGQAGDATYTGKADAQGKYEISLNVPPRVGTQIAVKQSLEGKKDSEYEVTEVQTGLEVSKLNRVTSTDTTVTGTGTPNTKAIATIGNATLEGTVNDKGELSIDIEDPHPAGTDIVVHLEDEKGRKSGSKTTTVEQDIVYSLTANEYKMGQANITGTYGPTTGEVTDVVLVVNDVVTKVGVIQAADGTYKISANGFVTPTDKVEVAARKDRQIVKRETVTVVSDPIQYVLTANNYTMGESYVEGTYGPTTGEVTDVVLLVNGVVTKIGAIQQDDGTYKIAGKGFFTENDTVEVAARKDRQIVKREPVQVSATQPIQYELTANPYTIGQANITGTYGPPEEITKVVLYVNGTAVKNSALDSANGTYSAAANSFITSPSDTVEVVASKGTMVVKRETVNVTTP